MIERLKEVIPAVLKGLIWRTRFICGGIVIILIIIYLLQE